MSYLQLGLVALLAPIFTAGAITQEKDSQTYDILLATPLTNGQIVLGSLLTRLFFVVALLVSGIPIFSITQIFGGVAISSIVQSFLIAAATAFVTGALAMAIAVFKVGTRRTIFSFYLFIVIYLVGLFCSIRSRIFRSPAIKSIPTLLATSVGSRECSRSWRCGPCSTTRLTTPPLLGDLPLEFAGVADRLVPDRPGWFLHNVHVRSEFYAGHAIDRAPAPPGAIDDVAAQR